MTGKLEYKSATLSVDDAGSITGIAWPFGSPDSVGDVISKGAISAPANLPMLFGHDHMQVVGVWDEITETNDGLTVKGRLLIDDVERAREVRAMIQSKAISGLSIGFRSIKSQPRPNSRRGRNISALSIHEISIVAVPSHPDARITSFKSADISESNFAMDNEENNQNENLAAEIKSMQSDMAIMKAKLSRPSATREADEQAENLEVKSFGAMLRRGVERISPDEVKALTVSNDANGGFLAPAEFGNELIKLLNEYSPIRQYARTVNISASEIKYPRRVSGTAATWVGETDDRTASGMNFEQLTLAPHELATFTDVSNQLLEDNAYALESELLSDFAESFGKTEGLAFIKGTGTGQPKGIMTSEGIKEITTGAADGFSDTNPADTIIGMYHSIPTTHAHNGVWLMNRKTLGTIRQWKDGNGRYLIVDPITVGGASTLLGRPVVEMPDMDDIAADQAPILFGDLSGYRIVDRLGLSTLRDPYSLAGKGQVRFHARKRVGAGLTHPDRFVKLVVGV